MSGHLKTKAVLNISMIIGITLIMVGCIKFYKVHREEEVNTNAPVISQDVEIERVYGSFKDMDRMQPHKFDSDMERKNPGPPEFNRELERDGVSQNIE